MKETAVRERPILFSGPMVRAILEGRKTQTRRTIKDADYLACLTGDCRHDSGSECAESIRLSCPYGRAGERLWVRETWATHQAKSRPWYRADREIDGVVWKPSIHMPRWASRITLEITDVRAQRLQEISPEDAIAEGIEERSRESSNVCGFVALWCSIHGKDAWIENPWVWAITFKKISA